MKQFIEVQSKGLDKCWVENALDPERLHLHVTELSPGSRPHAGHTHSGVEAFYLLEGSGVIETEEGPITLQINQAVILDATKKHGLVNTGCLPMKYLVIIVK